MKYNLKKTETTDAETIEHCLTVVECLLSESFDAYEDKNDTLSKKKWKEAKKYLKRYIKELFKQQLI
jgi:hypothetical protein